MPSPAQPAQPALEFENCYVLTYRDKLAQKTSKTFYCPGGAEKAEERARLHCTRLNMRYISVVPFFSDLLADEQKGLV